ncbi:MAG TPA: guanylate kinase [Fervidobacterium sp.]|nr:guanylate kinase [Fervidobacterium sp.]HPT54628.1 guanylate kinase [Fervidobacterium sp.]HPZ18071.1 guanylate kinase [Fervidobacterium sp.]HQE49289.1 guanylate kinase [Fervidobacterium sp.]HUM43054.1 guanylate kinase [Fervidobacterium sp.]
MYLPSSGKGILFVISGPSGVGKTSIIRSVLERVENVVFSISCTTRKQRPGEIHGMDYFFVSHQEFESMINENKFIEWAKVHDNYYGTPANFVFDHINNGIDVILDIDVQGALNVKKNLTGGKFVFVAPPSYQTLSERLRRRGTESEEKIQKRLDTAKKELSCIPEFEYLIINEDLEHSIMNLISIIYAERLRYERQKETERVKRLLLEVQ